MTDEEFDAFYQASFPRLVAQLWAITGELTEAQDVVQDAFIRAWDHRSALENAQSPEAWVRRVTSRIAVSRWRRAKGALLAWTRNEAITEATTSAPTPGHVALVDALETLPAAQREAIVLHHLCDLSVDDVAAQVNAPVGTVKAHLSRGRTALAPLLGDDLPVVTRG